MRRVDNAVVVESLSNQLGREEIAVSLAVELVVQVDPDVIEEFTDPGTDVCSVVDIVLGGGVMELLVPPSNCCCLSLHRCTLPYRPELLHVALVINIASFTGTLYRVACSM